MRMIVALTCILLALSAVLAQNPAPGSVLMPFSLEGQFASSIALAADNRACYTVFSGNQTGATWTQLCRAFPTSPEEIVTVIYMSAPSVVACGQNQQLGMSTGVFGGFLSGNSISPNTSACVYFTRIDGLHQSNGTQNALLQMKLYRNVTTVDGVVGCEAVAPSTLPTEPLTSFRCTSGTCLTQVMSSYCDSGNLHSVYQIGIGMGIGGIGLLLTTLALIIIISYVVQG